MTTTAVLLFSFAPVTLFFLMSGAEYPFFVILNVVFFALCGAMGVLFLRQGMVAISDWDNPVGARQRQLVFVLWVILYGFVGSQLAWILSPFMHEPGTPFVLFREMGSNFYSGVYSNLMRLLGY